MNCRRLGCWVWKIQNGIQKVWHKGLLFFFAMIQWRLFVICLKGLALIKVLQSAHEIHSGCLWIIFVDARIIFNKDRWRWVLCTYINGWYLFASLLVGVCNLYYIVRTRTFFSHLNSSQHDLNLGRGGFMLYPWGDDPLWLSFQMAGKHQVYTLED